MDLILWLLAAALITIGVLGTVLPVLPGAPLVLVGCFLAAWIDDFEKIGWLPLTIIGVCGVCATLADILGTVLGAKKFGASSYALWGATLGMIFGLFFGLFGLLFGPLLGAAAGEFAAKKDLLKAGTVGLGTWVGIVLGGIVKIALTITMAGVLLFSLLI